VRAKVTSISSALLNGDATDESTTEIVIWCHPVWSVSAEIVANIN
jgi:hypothetical protein